MQLIDGMVTAFATPFSPLLQYSRMPSNIRITGLVNNFGYVIMLSGAEDIMSKYDSDLGTG